jgi:putative Holliday junction resolvase
VETCDERLTTVDAKARLFELGGYKKLDKQKIDSVSACLIFESWIETQY